MNFWETSTSEAIESKSTFDASNNFQPIPDNTDVLCVVENAAWANNQYNGDYIAIEWQVLVPEEYANRKIFQNIKVMHDNEKTADKAKKMLATIDYNAGGKMLKSGEQPDDAMLTKSLTGKQMILKLQVWEMAGDDGQTRSGNWVCAVSGKKDVKLTKKQDEDIDF
tara:strand:- start:228 stop:725 length:498 start_codon:yes stop_codon:yes gene_type:complete